MIMFMSFEAISPLPGSFPIEVAWVDEDGQEESYLIRPHEEWLDAAAGHPGWSPQSEAVHGSALETLLADGVPAVQVARRVAEVLERANVVAYSDNVEFDGRWLRVLLETGGFAQTPRLLDVRGAYGSACRPLRDVHQAGPTTSQEQADRRFCDLALEIYLGAEEAEALRPRVHHGALPNARSLRRTWQAIRNDVARRVAGELVVSRTPLFSATWRGRRSIIGVATDVDLGPITRPVLPHGLRDVLEPSMLITIRTSGYDKVFVHALGWRVDLLKTWITSGVVGIDGGRAVVSTSSGHAYGLGDIQYDRSVPELIDHLDYALRTWGFEDVSAV